MSHAVSVCHGEFGRAALYRLDRTIITHAHREGHLIFYVGGSAAVVPVSGAAHPCNPRRAVAVSPWEPHSFHPPHGGECLCLVLYVKPMWFLENSRTAEFALSFGAPALEVTPRMAELVSRLVCLLLDDGRRGFDAMLFDLTWVSFERSWRREPGRPLDRARTRFSDFRVRRSMRLIQEHLADNVEMEQLARDVGLSRPHFFKLFKKQTGVTPNLYLNTLRAEQAILDLLSSDKTVTDIAFDLGFSSQASFTRFFSSNTGIAPSEYRRVADVADASFAMLGQRKRLSGTPLGALPH